jgi:hypothetical protein
MVPDPWLAETNHMRRISKGFADIGGGTELQEVFMYFGAGGYQLLRDSKPEGKMNFIFLEPMVSRSVVCSEVLYLSQELEKEE